MIGDPEPDNVWLHAHGINEGEGGFNYEAAFYYEWLGPGMIPLCTNAPVSNTPVSSPAPRVWERVGLTRESAGRLGILYRSPYIVPAWRLCAFSVPCSGDTWADLVLHASDSVPVLMSYESNRRPGRCGIFNLRRLSEPGRLWVGFSYARALKYEGMGEHALALGVHWDNLTEFTDEVLRLRRRGCLRAHLQMTYATDEEKSALAGLVNELLSRGNANDRI